MTLSVLSEFIADRLLPERGKFVCGTKVAGLMRQKPNCVSYYKNAEGPMVEYRFNECGYRSQDPCGPKPPGTVRVVFMGTSLTMGLNVRTEDMFTVRTERALNHLNRCVNVQNLAGLMSLKEQANLVGEALALAPDVIVLAAMPYDLEGLGQPEPVSVQARAGSGRLDSLGHDIAGRLRGTKTVFAIAHFLLQDQQTLYRYYLTEGGSRDIMSSPLTASGQRMYDGFAAVLRPFIATARTARVPVVVMAVPNRVAAAMVSTGSKIAGIDGASFGARVCGIAAAYGAVELDVTPEFARVPDAERLFYAVDNHPTGAAHALMAQALTRRLLDGSIPQLSAAKSPDSFQQHSP